MSQNGFITNVAVVKAGSNLALDAALSATTLFVDDASDFNESGGTVEINGTTYTYTAADLELDTITLTTGLTLALDTGFPVSTLPYSLEKRASILMGDGDTIDVRVPHNLYDRVPEGIRDDAARESVTVEINGGEWAIVDVFGKVPAIDATFLMPSTVPHPATDGLPPGLSPMPIAQGSVGVIFLKWQAIENPDPVTYQVHISTTDAFTAAPATLLEHTIGNFMVVRTDVAGAVVQYGTTYYFRIVAEDDDGAATQSIIASASPLQVTNADVIAGYIYAGNIFAEQITGGKFTSDITLASTIKTADTGARVELNALGMLITDSTGAPTTRLGTDAENFFKGTIEANGITVNGGLTLRGTTNEISRSSSLTLAQGVTASTNAPSVVVDWEKLALKDSFGNGFPQPGNLLGLTRTPDGKWLAADSSGWIRKWNADGTYNTGIANLPTDLTNAVQPASGSAIYAMSAGGYISRRTEEDVFTDAFSGTLAGWPSSTGTTAIDTGRAKVTYASGATSLIKRTLEGSFATRSIQAKVVVPTNRYGDSFTYMTLDRAVSGDSYSIWLKGNVLTFQMYVGGTVMSAVVTYDSIAHAYWRMFEFNGTVTLQTSPDNFTWTTQASRPHGWSTLTGLTVEFRGTQSAAPHEMLWNGDFESTISGWTGNGGGVALSRVTSPVRSASGSAYSLRYNRTVTANSVWSDPANVTPGNTYALASWHQSATASNDKINATFMWYDSSNLFLSQDQLGDISISNTAWTSVAGTKTAPVGAVSLRIAFLRTSTATPNGYMYLDDVTVTESGTTRTENLFVDDFRYSMATGQIAYTRLNTSQAPALGASGGNLLVAEFDATNHRIVIKNINPNDMATIISTLNTSTNAGFAGPLAGVMKGTFDFPEDRYIVSRFNVPSVYWWSFKSSDGSYQADDPFPVITGGHKGIGWDGTNFWALGTDASLYKHTNLKWAFSTDSDAWKVGFTWFDGASQESGVSPYASLTMKMRARLTVTSASIPYAVVGDPDRIRVYVGRGAGSKYLQATTAALVNTSTLITATFSGTVAPTVSTFVNAVAAKIRNPTDTLVFSADGSAKVASLIVGTDTSEIWHVVGNGTTGLGTTFANGTPDATYIPAFKKDANGVVHVRGFVAYAASTATTTMFTLPVGYRPSAQTPALSFITYCNPVGVIGRITVDTAGVVACRQLVGATQTGYQLDFSFTTR